METKPVDECSVICSFHGRESAFKTVVAKLDGAKLPVRVKWETGVMSFYYDGRCDGNTQHFMELVIKGLVGLYKKSELHVFRRTNNGKNNVRNQQP